MFNFCHIQYYFLQQINLNNLLVFFSGCLETLKVYCFPCLLFGVEDRQKSWSRDGYNDWGHLTTKAKIHEKSDTHINNSSNLQLYGVVNIRDQLSDSYRNTKTKHNLEVDKNRHVLSRIIDSIKFCGSFELALRGHDESEDSNNPGVFLGLINFASELDDVLRKHLQEATVFKGTSATIQNELLDIMYAVCLDNIKNEISNANFLAVISDDTTDISNYSQNVVVFRYLNNNGVVERFYSFCTLGEANAEALAEKIKDRICQVLPADDDKEKLIAQCYDGAAVMRGEHGGVQTLIRKVYPNAQFIHCWAHQFNLVIQQAVSSVPELDLFFLMWLLFLSFYQGLQSGVNT